MPTNKVADEWTASEEPFLQNEENVMKEGASVSSTVINSVKSVLGAGILTLSWSFYFSSMWPGVLGTLLLCLLSAHGFYLIGLCSDRTGQSSFGSMWTSLFGPKWSWAPDLVIVVFCGTAVVSYLIVVGDFLPRGLSAFGVPLMDRRVYILVASLCILPLNFKEDLSALAYTSIVGNFSILYTVALLIYLCAGSDLDADWEPWEVQPGIFVTIPALAFSFNGHFGVPQMYQGLQAKSPKRWLKVTTISFSICLPVVLVCAITGYLMFGSSLTLPDRSNVLMAPSLNGRPSVMMAYIFMTFACLFNIPICISCVKNAIDSILVNKNNADPSPAAVSKRKRVSSAIIVVVTFLTALATNSLGLSVAINGAVCATLMMFVFPALMFMKSSPEGGSCLFERVLPMTTLLLGLIIGIAGVTTTVMLDMGMQADLVKQ